MLYNGAVKISEAVCIGLGLVVLVSITRSCCVENIWIIKPWMKLRILEVVHAVVLPVTSCGVVGVLSFLGLTISDNMCDLSTICDAVVSFTLLIFGDTVVTFRVARDALPCDVLRQDFSSKPMTAGESFRYLCVSDTSDNFSIIVTPNGSVNANLCA